MTTTTRTASDTGDMAATPGPSVAPDPAVGSPALAGLVARVDGPPAGALPPPSSSADDGGTVVPPADHTGLGAAPGRVRLGVSREEVLQILGAAASALGLGSLVCLVLGIIPVGWMPVVCYLCFMLTYTVLVWLRDSGQQVRDRFWTVLLWSAAAAAVGTLALIVGFVLVSGRAVFGQLFAGGQSLAGRLHFFTQDMGTVGPLADLSQGGVLHAIVGTLIQIAIALAFTLPLGVATALFLAEVGGRMARVVRTVVDAMTALPSVVAGLFIYATVITAVTHQFNGFAASLSITVLMLPVMIRSADVVLRLVPGNLREAGLALGASQWMVIRLVVLPTVRSGLITAIILATALGIGETAPVLLTAGVTNNLNLNPLRGSMTSLPLAALEFVASSQNTMKARGFATAAVLLILVLILFLLARRFAGQEPGKLTDRQAMMLARRSEQTALRMRDSLALAARQLAAMPPATPVSTPVPVAPEGRS